MEGPCRCGWECGGALKPGAGRALLGERIGLALGPHRVRVSREKEKKQTQACIHFGRRKKNVKREKKSLFLFVSRMAWIHTLQAHQAVWSHPFSAPGVGLTSGTGWGTRASSGGIILLVYLCWITPEYSGLTRAWGEGGGGHSSPSFLSWVAVVVVVVAVVVGKRLWVMVWLRWGTTQPGCRMVRRVRPYYQERTGARYQGRYEGGGFPGRWAALRSPVLVPNSLVPLTETDTLA